MSSNTIAAAVSDAVKGAVKDAIQDPTVPVASELPSVAAARIAEAVTPEVKAVVAHATNNEPWHQSRVALGSIGTIVSSGFGLYALWASGVTNGELYAPLITAMIGAAIALYGRFVATKPLGA
ncbi:hypothetical protein [Enterovirga aerilata]|uniref:Uncharacterized protein n=1 Tax=Enterovirga aerilata TaxID=2730920 RepID=A0A849ICE5_9HYPH|nr:hypothetical protein [Enterovirga sp. DB1703]NNM75078.1 hypothetical protein [Enterovirga sp. DB1703]